MKKQILLMASIMTVGMLTACARENQTDKQEIKKGFFSIGNNAEKLAPLQTIAAEQTAASVAQKGFYNIGDNEKKLASPGLKMTNSTNSKRPVIQKGYYSIGNNADKLR